MKNPNTDLNKIFCSNKNLISRRNQDNTVIIMKLDDANTFYKISDLAANIWNLFQSPANAQDILTALLTKFSPVPAEQVKTDFNAFVENLLALNFLELTNETLPASKNTDATALFSTLGEYTFGQVKEYDLAQIESEVLNESIYLDVFAGSDLRLKKEILPLKNPLEKILSLEGISYLWNENTAGPNAPTTAQIGLIAQQVASVMPDLVRKDTQTNLLAINYTKITPYLVESIKELKSLIDSQNLKIAQLEADLKKLKH